MAISRVEPGFETWEEREREREGGKGEVERSGVECSVRREKVDVQFGGFGRRS